MREHPTHALGANNDRDMNGNMGLVGVIPVTITLAFINYLTYIKPV
jgi:hypothetical protein